MLDTPHTLCVGILVADLFTPPLPTLPAAGELRATDDFLLTIGGCAANVAVDLARLGVRTAVSGRVGNDIFGDFIEQELRRQGIDASGIRRSAEVGTSKTVVLPVIGEDRRFIHTFGANAVFDERDIPDESIPENGVLYVGGFLIMPALTGAAVARLFQLARERNTKTVLDVVVPAGEGSGEALRQVEAILPYTDYFLPNDEEAHALTGETDPRRQAQRFRDAGCRTVVITQGNRGTLLMSEEEILEADTYDVEFLDGSGSGDAFAAGFIAGLLEGWENERLLRFAAAIGASACTKLGCTTGVFTREEAEAFLQQNALHLQKSQA